ncbi:MAG: TfoX/Sxy family protein [Chryseolinea sp.]
MPYDEKLAARVRESLAHVKKVEEKFMFRGVCFMLNGKMCVCVGADELMCRIGPDKFDEALERNGTRAMVRGGKAMKGFVFVSPEGYRTRKDYQYFIDLSLKFNKFSEPAKPKKRKKEKKRE